MVWIYKVRQDFSIINSMDSCCKKPSHVPITWVPARSSPVLYLPLGIQIGWSNDNPFCTVGTCFKERPHMHITQCTPIAWSSRTLKTHCLLHPSSRFRPCIPCEVWLLEPEPSRTLRLLTTCLHKYMHTCIIGRYTYINISTHISYLYLFFHFFICVL